RADPRSCERDADVFALPLPSYSSRLLVHCPVRQSPPYGLLERFHVVLQQVVGKPTLRLCHLELTGIEFKDLLIDRLKRTSDSVPGAFHSQLSCSGARGILGRHEQGVHGFVFSPMGMASTTAHRRQQGL